MQADKEQYRGYSIMWDTNQPPGKDIWTAKAAVLAPADPRGGIPRLEHQVAGPSEGFRTETEARDYVLRLAKEWIDSRPHDVTTARP